MRCTVLRVGTVLGGSAVGVRRVSVGAGFTGRSSLKHFFEGRAKVALARCHVRQWVITWVGRRGRARLLQARRVLGRIGHGLLVALKITRIFP